ncbi:MAG: sigma-70 family RNA polymerase sigma factor [Turneriella sp.]|nr:sigma-70 family RNA polymerase sigma factor [Turneriella sp.]
MKLEGSINKISQIPILPQETQLKLAADARAGDTAALQKLIYHNLRLVVHLASFHMRHARIEELIGEGTAGLMKAAGSFNPDRGYSFVSYASFFIREAISRYLREVYSSVHFPKNRLNQLRAEGTNPFISTDSWERLISSREGEQLMAADCVNDPADQFEEKDLIERVWQYVGELPKLYQVIIKHRYGLGNRKIRTLQFLGQKLHLRREKARQYELAALRMLRLKCEAANITGA